MRRQVDLLLELLMTLQSLPQAEGGGNPLDRQGRQRTLIVIFRALQDCMFVAELNSS